VRVFVAATPAEWLPQRVLEFSIKEMTLCKVDLRALYTFEREYLLPKDIKNRPRTPFSFQRFLIPEICDYSGLAIYMDADMQVFKDIESLWSIPLNGNSIQTVRPSLNGRKGQFSVMLMDCSALNWNVDEIVHQLDLGAISYEQLMYEMDLARSIGRDISSDWNMLEVFDDTTSLLHYTDMDMQPWVSITNPLGGLWMKCLRRAIEAGFISLTELRREVASGHVRPSLLFQMEHGIDDVRELPRSAKALDTSFVAPYKKIKSAQARPWASPVAMVNVRFRTVLKKIKWVYGR
jgi:hypothetical protein